MFSPDERTVGGAFLIQQEFENGMSRFINRVRTTPSQYAPQNIPPPFKKPSAPKFLSSNFRRIDPRYCVPGHQNTNSSSSARPTSSSSGFFLGRRKSSSAAAQQQQQKGGDGKSPFTSRINNDMPSSFAFSLKNRKREEENKKYTHEIKEARRPNSARGREEAKERRHVEIQRKILEHRPGWDATTQVCTSHNKFIRTYHENVAAFTAANEATHMANAATETGDELIADIVDEQNKSNVPRPVMPSTEMHGLNTLLADCSREEQIEKIKIRQSRFLDEQKKQRQLRQQRQLLQKLEYSGDGIAKFMDSAGPASEETKRMILAQFSRIECENNNNKNNNDPEVKRLSRRTTNHFQEKQDHPPAGALVKEAARRILQRVDCMGGRVKEYHRQNIANSIAQMVPLRKTQNNDEDDENENTSTLEHPTFRFPTSTSTSKPSHQNDQEQQQQPLVASSSTGKLARKNSKLTFVEAKEMNESDEVAVSAPATPEKDNNNNNTSKDNTPKQNSTAKQSENDDENEEGVDVNNTRACASTPPPQPCLNTKDSNDDDDDRLPPSIVLTKETPNSNNNNSNQNKNQDSSSRQQVILEYSEDDQEEEDGKNDKYKLQNLPSTTSPIATTTTRVPAPPSRGLSASNSRDVIPASSNSNEQEEREGSNNTNDEHDDHHAFLAPPPPPLRNVSEDGGDVTAAGSPESPSSPLDRSQNPGHQNNSSTTVSNVGESSSSTELKVHPPTRFVIR